MKRRALVLGTVLTLAGIAVACSVMPTEPPIDTSGPTSVTAGGGPPAEEGGTASDDAGTTTVTPPQDGAIVDSANDVANSCTFGTCFGCCLPDAACELGSTSAACGTGGTACQICTAQQTCIATVGCQ